jgi:hypothetical protein
MAWPAGGDQAVQSRLRTARTEYTAALAVRRLEMAPSRVQDPGVSGGRKWQAGHGCSELATMAPTPPARPLPSLFLSLVPRRGVVRRPTPPRPSSSPPRSVCLRGVLHIRISCRAVFDTCAGPTVHPGEPQGKGSLEGLHRPDVSFP